MTTKITAYEKTLLPVDDITADIARRRSVLQETAASLFQELGGEPLSTLGVTITQEKTVPKLTIELDAPGDPSLELAATLTSIEMLWGHDGLSIQIES